MLYAKVLSISVNPKPEQRCNVPLVKLTLTVPGQREWTSECTAEHLRNEHGEDRGFDNYNPYLHVFNDNITHHANYCTIGKICDLKVELV